MKKIVKLLFKNPLYFGKNNIPTNFKFGKYLEYIIINGLKFNLGALILATVGIVSAHFIGLLMYEQKYSDVPMYNIDGGKGHKILVTICLVLIFYGLLSFIHYVIQGFKKFSYLISAENRSNNKLQNQFNAGMKAINKDLQKELINKTLKNENFNHSIEYEKRKKELISILKLQFIENGLRKNRNISSNNISLEKVRLESVFNDVIN